MNAAEPISRTVISTLAAVASSVLSQGSEGLARLAPEATLTVCLHGDGATESAPHGNGNIYAPSVVIDGLKWRMWYGGQGTDGHDRIHYAESHDEGWTWTKLGVVVENETANHVNDPSVLRVGDSWFMFYTVAEQGTEDAIALATSSDGRSWKKRGVVLAPAPKGGWDSRLVGRPSVLHDEGIFKMWFDGRAVPNSPEAAELQGQRAVGYATSTDGLQWARHAAKPVFEHNAGAVDVVRTSGGYTLLYEGSVGTSGATSSDGLVWKDCGLLARNSGTPLDRFGQLTPHAVRVGNRWRVFVGAAGRKTWDGNAVAWFALDRLPMDAVAQSHAR